LEGILYKKQIRNLCSADFRISKVGSTIIRGG